MKRKYLTISFLIVAFFIANAQTKSFYSYDVSKENPFGKYNPTAPKQVQDFKDFIGECNCTSQSRKPDGSWALPIKMIWRWKYIMNGTAVQDETLKEDGKHSGSIRQFNKDSMQWNVHYYSSSPTVPLNFWKGSKNKDGNIVLYKEQKAPNGTDGFSRLTFYDINKMGYKWIGEWVDKSEKVTFPFWKIVCVKKEN